MVRKGLLRVEDLPVSEDLFFKKDVFGYRIVNPNRDPFTNKIVWVNVLIGGWRNFFVLLILLGFVLLFFYAHEEMTSELRVVADSPCEFCSSCFEVDSGVGSSINLSLVNATLYEYFGGGSDG